MLPPPLPPCSFLLPSSFYVLSLSLASLWALFPHCICGAYLPCFSGCWQNSCPGRWQSATQARLSLQNTVKALPEELTEFGAAPANQALLGNHRNMHLYSDCPSLWVCVCCMWPNLPHLSRVSLCLHVALPVCACVCQCPFAICSGALSPHTALCLPPRASPDVP